jgi:bacteriochlorophyll 4-vinyl reductase
VQHELLKAVRNQMPALYARAAQELGYTVSRSQELIDSRVEIVSSARAIKLARLIASEPNVHGVFGDAGHNLSSELSRGVLRPFRAGIRNLPLSLRMRLALNHVRKFAFGFAGSSNRILAEHHRRNMALTLCDGVFTDRLDTLGGANEYYRRILENLLRELARADCEVRAVRGSKVRLNRCDYEIVWEA